MSRNRNLESDLKDYFESKGIDNISDESIKQISKKLDKRIKKSSKKLAKKVKKYIEENE